MKMSAWYSIPLIRSNLAAAGGGSNQSFSTNYLDFFRYICLPCTSWHTHTHSQQQPNEPTSGRLQNLISGSFGWCITCAAQASENREEERTSLMLRVYLMSLRRDTQRERQQGDNKTPQKLQNDPAPPKVNWLFSYNHTMNILHVCADHRVLDLHR